MKITTRTLTICVATALLSACGGGGGSSNLAGVGGSGITSGVITGFGSVFVDGIEYNTANATITMDGQPATEQDLKVGMKVRLQGSTNGTTGTATSIDFRDEVEGIVKSNSNGTLDVMGLTVQTDNTTEFSSKVASITSIAGISQGNIVEVSGPRLDATTIQATRIEVKAQRYTRGNGVEVKGDIANLDTTAQTFKIGSQTVDYSATSLPAGAGNGTYVQVRSTQGLVGSHLVASKVSLEDGGDMAVDGTEGEDIKLSGPVGNNPTSSRFTLDGTTVRVTSNTEFKNGSASNLVAKTPVKVEGTLDANGDLVATEVKFGEKAKAEMRAHISNVDPAQNRVTLMGLAMQVNNNTMKVDDSSSPDHYFNLTKMHSGDYVEVAFYKNGSGNWIATKIKRISVISGNQNQPTTLEGTVTNMSGTTLTVGGVNVDVSNVTPLPSNVTTNKDVTITLASSNTANNGSPLLATKINVNN